MSGVLAGGPGMVSKPIWRVARGFEAHPEVWEWSGSPPGVSGGVGRDNRLAGSGWEAHPVVREGLVGPPVGPEDRETHPDIWESSGCPPKGPEGVGKPTRRFGWGQEAYP